MDLAQIRHVAELAELSLTPEEEARLVAEIGRIVAYVAELDAVDTTDVEPTAQVAGGGRALREDEPEPCLPHDEALSQAPRVEHGGFSVPTFVES